MPIGHVCRTCGAGLAPDLGWCPTCYEPVRTLTRRPPLHEPGSFVGIPTAAERTSRWRAGPTTFGPVGRIVWTVGVAALFPWWGLGGFNPLFLWALMGWVLLATVVLRQVWRRERVADDAAPSVAERFGDRHPVLGRPLRLGSGGRLVLVAAALAVAVAAWVGLDDVGRYLWSVVALVTVVGLFLARWNDL